ncbi:MAG TPA: AMP-binding protein [Acidobacteriaceae bacterium]|nr:AMP-binding protein [Acidobacteriaceae bacterium]
MTKAGKPVILHEAKNLYFSPDTILVNCARIHKTMRKHLATLVEDFQRHGKQIAIVSYPGNRRFPTTYAELATLAGRFSHLLFDRGIAPGERVLLWGANSAEWVAAFFGCVLRGVIAVPLDAAGSVDFAIRVVDDVTPRLIVGDAQHLQKLKHLDPQPTAKMSFEDFSSALPASPMFQPEPSLNTDTPLQILFTSGTTSAPKGIVHTHGNVLSSVEVLEREIQKYLRYERWVHPLRFLHTLPLSHVFGQFMGLWVPPLLAAQVHYEDNLVASHLMDRIHRERISVAAVVPRVLELLRVHLLSIDPRLQARLNAIQNQRVWKKWWRLRDIHRRFGFKFWAFVSGAASLPAEVEQFWNALGFVLVQGYGMTETTALATLNHPFHPARGSIGKPLAGREVRVADDGEILVRGPMLAAGTWRHGGIEPRSGDWLHTGDLGAVDPSGQMRFLGRKSDVIVAASGMNIHPEDLEQAVRAQPGVRDCVVVAWESPRGPEPVAVVILQNKAQDAGLTQILSAANRAMQEFQQIRSILPWPADEFPRNSMGKLLRREVAAWVREQLGPEITSSTLTPSQDPLLRLLQQLTGQSVENLDDSAELATDLHLDSLGRMQLAMAMEEQFGVSISDAEVSAARTLADLRKLLHPAQAGERGDLQTVNEKKAELTEPGVPQVSPLRPGIGKTNMAAPSSPQPGRIGTRYPHWPWNASIQAARAIFVEGVVRPLGWLLAHPRVQCDPGALPAQPSIYVANHVTAMDVPLVLYALPRRVRQHMAVAMSAELLAAWRRRRDAAGVGAGPLRWLAPAQAQLITALFNVFPLPAGAGLRRSFAHAGEALDRGYNVLVFPEGQRTLTGELQSFQTGISLLAQESHTQVVPVGIVGLWQAAQRSGFSRLRPQGLAVRVGAPLHRLPEESHAAFAARLHAAVEQLSGIPILD